jgi:hypothetical protein
VDLRLERLNNFFIVVLDVEDFLFQFGLFFSSVNLHRLRLFPGERHAMSTRLFANSLASFESESKLA